MTRLICNLRLKFPGLAVLLCVAGLIGCGKNEVQVYRVAKETPTEQAQPPAATEPADTSSTSAPSLQWKLPEGWKEVPPGQMRLASFVVEGSGGRKADVSIVPLPGMAGNDLDNVNRWRGQVGQSPISAEDLAKIAESVEVAGQPAKLFDQGGALPDSGAKARILAAIFRREGVAWFFKMTGDDALVAEQKPAFVNFLKSIQFTAPTASAAAQMPPDHPPLTTSATPPASASVGDSPKPAWTVPAGWQETSGGQFLFAKFQIAGDNGSQAAVNVSTSAGDGGGLLANVNRWRGQLGLPPMGEADLTRQIGSLDVAGGKAMFIDMSGTDARSQQKARLIGAMVSQPGQAWFYKLMGNDQLVGREASAFTNFVQTVKYPNGQ